MPRLSDLIKAPPEGKYGPGVPFPTQHPVEAHNNLPSDPQAPSFNVNLRCPMPATGTVSPDSLRQFYRTGTPQFRVFTK